MKVPVNLERSLKLGDEIGGHLVSGHIHAKAKVISFNKAKENLLKIELPSSISNFILKKGYVAINGISLTVVKVTKKSFVISIIPETLKNTNLKYVNEGDLLILKLINKQLLLETLKKLRQFNKLLSPASAFR